jgi:hypothetical protein
VRGGFGDDHIALFDGAGDSYVDGDKGDDHILMYQENSLVIGGEGTDTVEVHGEYVTVQDNVENINTHVDGMECRVDEYRYSEYFSQKLCVTPKDRSSPSNPAFNADDCAAQVAAGAPTCDACCPYSCTEKSTTDGYDFLKLDECVCVTGDTGLLEKTDWGSTPSIRLPKQHSSCAFVSGENSGVSGGYRDDHITLIGVSSGSASGGRGDDHITVHTKDGEYSTFVSGGAGDDTVKLYGDGKVRLDSKIDGSSSVETVVEHDGISCEEYTSYGWTTTICE